MTALPRHSVSGLPFTHEGTIGVMTRHCVQTPPGPGLSPCLLPLSPGLALARLLGFSVAGPGPPMPSEGQSLMAISALVTSYCCVRVDHTL